MFCFPRKDRVVSTKLKSMRLGIFIRIFQIFKFCCGEEIKVF